MNTVVSTPTLIEYRRLQVYRKEFETDSSIRDLLNALQYLMATARRVQHLPKLSPDFDLVQDIGDCLTDCAIFIHDYYHNSYAGEFIILILHALL